jgi:hypothetical protein
MDSFVSGCDGSQRHWYDIWLCSSSSQACGSLAGFIFVCSSLKSQMDSFVPSFDGTPVALLHQPTLIQWLHFTHGVACAYVSSPNFHQNYSVACWIGGLCSQISSPKYLLLLICCLMNRWRLDSLVADGPPCSPIPTLQQLRLIRCSNYFTAEDHVTSQHFFISCVNGVSFNWGHSCFLKITGFLNSLILHGLEFSSAIIE